MMACCLRMTQIESEHMHAAALALSIGVKRGMFYHVCLTSAICLQEWTSSAAADCLQHLCAMTKQVRHVHNDSWF